MSVEVTKTGGYRAEITWDPEDDPHGRIAQLVERVALAYALELLGRGPLTETYDAGATAEAARHSTELARQLRTAAALQVVRLRDEHRESWPRIASAVHNDPDKHASVRRQYEAGRRQLGT